MKALLPVCALLLIFAASTSAVRSALETPSPTPDGSPNPGAVQVLAGARVFSEHCASCHGAQLEGGAGPALTGPEFAATAKRDKLTIGVVFGMIAFEMPYDAPSSLSHTDYARVMAFLLKQNGHAPGAAELTYDGALKSAVPFIISKP